MERRTAHLNAPPCAGHFFAARTDSVSNHAVRQPVGNLQHNLPDVGIGAHVVVCGLDVADMKNAIDFDLYARVLESGPDVVLPSRRVRLRRRLQGAPSSSANTLPRTAITGITVTTSVTIRRANLRSAQLTHAACRRRLLLRTREGDRAAKSRGTARCPGCCATST